MEEEDRVVSVNNKNRMENKKWLTEFRSEVSAVERKADAIEITKSEEYANAVDIVAKLKEIGSKIKEKKESLTKPLNEALRNARELFAPLEMQFSNAEGIIKGKLLDYKRKKDEEARIEEARIAARVEKGTLKIETAERKMEAVERIDTTTRGDVGEISIRQIKKVRIVNESLIPREYLQPDMVAIRRDALGGKAIAGVIIEEVEVVAAGNW